ncbi:MAG: hypothetical protein ACLFPS_07500 [Clostridia bacterium]
MKRKLIFITWFILLFLILIAKPTSALRPSYRIEEIYYNDLNSALNEANDGDTIELLENASISDPISVTGKAITIDLNSFDMHVNVSKPASISASEGAQLIIKDLAASGGALTVATSSDHYGLYAFDGGNNSCTYKIINHNIT